MKLLLVACTALCVALSSLAAGAKTAVDRSAAPADEYFGTQKMSALGIRMRVDALGRMYHARTIADNDLIHDASLAEASLRNWDERYPRDPWLAPTAFHLEQLYAAVQSSDGRTHATSLLHSIVGTFGTTRFGHLSRLRLAQGFPPLQNESPVVLTSPTATGANSPAPSDAPTGATSPAPLASPSASLPPH